MASDIFRSFVQRWLLQGSLEDAEAEDLAHLSNSAVKLNILEERCDGPQEVAGLS